ncbi:MAG: hypothetical protein KDB35_18415 [Acidimicrobiales bacterium]|nr:hypothetical protein [Acidimicrobiales bacterium]
MTRAVGVRLRVGMVMAFASLALVVLAACGGGGSSSGGGEPNPGERFPDRANQFREDQERSLGDAARLSGYTTTVESVAYDGDGTVTVSVRIDNRDAEPQPMFSTDWQLVSPDVTTYEPVSSTLPSTGEVGDEPVTGDVVFEVDALEATGDFYVVYKPDRLDAARGIWQLQVPDGSAPAAAP